MEPRGFEPLTPCVQSRARTEPRRINENGQGAVIRITLGFPALLFYWYRLFWLDILGVNFVSCKTDSCPGRTTSMGKVQVIFVGYVGT